MANNFAGLMIILLMAQGSANLLLIMLGDATLLAWLNQIFLGLNGIAVTSYLIAKRGTRQGAKAEGGG